MQAVQCPHCATQVMNDGSLSGQVVSCPRCRGQFLMPPVDEGTSTIKKQLRELRQRRKRTSFREWCDERFGRMREFTAEPLLFQLLTFTGAFFALGGGLAVIRLFGWRADASIRPLAIMIGSLMALLPVAVYALYRIQAVRKEAVVNATLDAQIHRLRRMLDERARQAAEAKRVRNEERYAARRQTAQQRQARHLAREKQFGLLATRYLVLWLAGFAIIFGLFGCAGGPLMIAVLAGVGDLVALFGWFLGRMDLKEKIDWRDRWERCPACHIPGAGKLIRKETLGERTVEEMRSQVASFYRDGKREGEIHYQVPSSYTIGSYGLFYECRSCNHKWVKVAEYDEIPLHYHNYLIEFQKQQVERAKRALESAFERALNPLEDLDS